MGLNFERYVEIIREAGDTILKMGEDENMEVRDKGGNDPLTEADLTANKILQKLQNEIPGSCFYSEELEDDKTRHTSPYVWIIDPIDGTREFVNKIPEYAVSAALVYHDKMVFSCVYNPNDSLVWQAENELQAPELMEGAHPGSPDKICVSRSECKRELFSELEKDFSFEPVGSIAFKLSLVAQGRFPGVLSLRPKNEWDIAGGVGLVEAARLTSCDVVGRKFQWNRPQKAQGVLAGKDELVRDLLADFHLEELFHW